MERRRYSKQVKQSIAETQLARVKNLSPDMEHDSHRFLFSSGSALSGQAKISGAWEGEGKQRQIC